MSDCRSVCTNYHQSSQSRKISIGIVLDSVAKRKLGAIKEDERKQPNSERIKPSNGISSEGKNKGEALTASKGKKIEDTERVKSPWITPRSVHQNSLAPETTSSNLRSKKHKNAKDVAVAYSVQFFSNQTFNAKNIGTKQNSFDSFNDDLTYKRKGRNDGNSQKEEDFNNGNAGKVLESDRVVLEVKVDEAQNVPTETLKMKLQELFGNVSSPKIQLSSSQVHGLKENNLKPDTSANHMGDTAVKPRQCSDTIETDSENPDQNIKRPVTRSLTRKKAQGKVQTDKTKDGLSSKQRQRESIFSFGEGRSTKLDADVNTKDGLSSKKIHRESMFYFGKGRSTKLDATANTKDGLHIKQKHRESIFTFGEGRSTNLDAAANTSSKLFGEKKIQKKSFKIDPRKICFTEEDNADEIKQTSYRSVTPVAAGKTSTLGNKMESFPDSFSGKMREKIEMEQEQHSFHTPVTTKKNQPVNFDNPTSPEDVDKQEDFGNISLRNDVYTPDNFRSPTFGFETPILNTSPSPTPKTVEIKQGAHSPVPSERGLTIGNTRSFRTFQASKPVRNKSNGKAHSPVSLTIIQDSDSDMEVKHIKRYKQSETSSQEKLSENSEDGLPISKRHDCHSENPTSPDTDVSEKPNFVPCPIKQRRNYEDVRLSECSPISASQKGARAGETFWFQGPSERDQEDELTRAVTLFASALQTFKRKMNSTTRKKSSEILVSISEEIKSLLLNAQTEIESDVGKLVSLNKTKKKCLETGLQEQQDRLKLILEKFKEDIHHHLLDCNNILEGMEAHQFELKGIMKKQKVSHQKLLMNVEEAAETLLNNAEIRVTAVHESSREKMLQLKRVIAECLKDSVY